MRCKIPAAAPIIATGIVPSPRYDESTNPTAKNGTRDAL